MKTLVILYPGCIAFEVLLACELLHSRFPVDIATPDGQDHQGSNGLTIKSNLSFERVSPEHYKAVLIPGGDPGSVIGHQGLNRILRESFAHGAILGAICAGPVVLEQAGLLENRRICHGYAGPQWEWLQERGFFQKTTLTDEPLQVDGPIVTARPDAYIDFAVEIAYQTGAIKVNQAEPLKNYYRGLGQGKQ